MKEPVSVECIHEYGPTKNESYSREGSKPIMRTKSILQESDRIDIDVMIDRGERPLYQLELEI